MWGKEWPMLQHNGQIFASPSSAIILEAIKAAEAGKGTLLIYNNYAGDVLNFEMAMEMAQDEGIKVEQVKLNDDVSSGAKDKREQQKGDYCNTYYFKNCRSCILNGHGS